MSSVQPFGDLRTASILVIGHDPRLQNSQTEARFAFFFEYLQNARPTAPSEAEKYDLANAVWQYMNQLAHQDLPLDALYVTNLCNHFLERGEVRGTLLIPDTLAQEGVRQIEQIVAQGHFKIIVPLSLQTFYHLCRLNFLDEDTPTIAEFIRAARPQAAKVQQGIYEQTGKSPFLSVCGRRFHHAGVPVVPVVHSRQWPLELRMVRYRELLDNARHHISTIMKENVL